MEIISGITHINWKGKEAARKAIDTFRYRQMENADFMQLLHLHDEIDRAEYKYEQDMEKQGYIARNIAPTPYRSFVKWGDRNNATPSLNLFWIRNKGEPLDIQAMYMNRNDGMDIEPDELARFMMDYDRGISMYEPVSKIVDMKQTFKELAGFNYDFRWIKKHLIVQEISSNDEVMPF